ncbi:hypothetical protein Tco_0985813 [Tanacetum coccineum]
MVLHHYLSPPRDELIGNLKLRKDLKKRSEIVKAKFERKSLALKAKKQSSDEECSTFKSEDEEYAIAMRRRTFIGECPKPPKDKNQREFVGGSWSDSGEEDDEKVNNETCLVAQASSESAPKANMGPPPETLGSEKSIVLSKIYFGS